MLTQDKISSVCDSLIENVHTVLDYFEIEFVEFPNRVSFACPIHGGDNSEGCCIFTDGLTNRGNWSCWTRYCHEEYVDNMFGFVRAVVSARLGRDFTMMETLDLCEKMLGTNFEDVQLKPKKNKSLIEIFNRKIQRHDLEVTREDITSRINIPSKYYIQRGFNENTLKTFDVGDCFEENKPMSGRVVVPIYDEDYNYIGCVGRSIKEHLKPKWLHSKGFSKNALYGLNIAKDYILKTNTVILVEGQGDVWKLFEAGLPMTVGIFGASINEDQLLLLEKSGALNVVILTDYDDAGNKAAEQILKKCGRRFNYIRPDIKNELSSVKIKDVGDMTTEQIKDLIFPYLEGII